jgi:arylsulfotransferase ASST
VTLPAKITTANFKPQAKRPRDDLSRRRHWLALATVAAFLLFGLSSHSAEAQPQAGQVSFSTTSLYPAFDPAVHDYVVRCHDAGVTVTASAQAGWQASINGHAFQSGTFSEPVPLASGKAFTVTFREDGGTTLYRYFARCLPDDFPTYTFTRLAPSSSPKFFTADPTANPSHFTAVFDRNGVPVWWDHAGAFVTRVLPSGNLLRCVGAHWGIHRLSDNSTIEDLAGVGMVTNHHDLQFRTGNHDHLVGDYVPREHVDLSAYGGPADATALDAELQEVTDDGQLVWDWKSQNHISLSETAPRFRATTTPVYGYYDLVHWNSIDTAGPNAVLASFRYLDAVYKISETTGNIIWKLGGSQTPQSLTVLGDPASQPFGGQHDARVLPDGTVTVFDNRYLLNQPPRVTRWRIDEQAHTATLIQKISDPAVHRTRCCGSARLLRDGSWLVDWGDNGTIGAYKPDGTPEFRLKFQSKNFSYRAEPVPPGAATLRDFRQAMNARCSSGCS